MIYLNLTLITFLLFYALAPLIGINFLWYDETWNFINLSSFGPEFVTTHYPAPNNHIFFTLLQSLIPRNTIYSYPLILRLIPLICLILFFYFSFKLLKKFSSLKNDLILWIVLIVFLTSEIFLRYTYFSRGYLLGSLMIVSGIYYFYKRVNFLIPSSLFALSVYTLPTNTIPISAFLLTLLFWRKFRLRSAYTILASGTISLYLYIPIYKEVLLNSKISWNTLNHEYLIYSLWEQSSLLLTLIIAVIIFLLPFFINKYFKIMVFSSILSVVIFEFLFYSKKIQLPFYRNFYYLLPLFLIPGLAMVYRMIQRNFLLQISSSIIITISLFYGLYMKNIFTISEEFKIYNLSKRNIDLSIQAGAYFEPTVQLFFPSVYVFKHPDPDYFQYKILTYNKESNF